MLLGVAICLFSSYTFFVNLADTGLGDGLDEQDLVWQLPFGEGTAEVFLQLFCGHVMPGPQYHHGQRPFLPLCMRNSDNCGVAHGRVAHEQVFHVDGGDPLTAALDHILDTVGELEVTVFVDRSDIS